MSCDTESNSPKTESFKSFSSKNNSNVPTPDVSDCDKQFPVSYGGDARPAPPPYSSLVLTNHSSEERQDDSVFDSSDRCDEDLEFSDSAVSPIKTSWPRDCDQVPWNNDTSPSDNLELEESLIGSNSYDHSPSDTSLSSHNIMHLSPVENSSECSEMKNLSDENASSHMYSDVNMHGQRKDIPVDALLNNVGRTSSLDTQDHFTSYEASGWLQCRWYVFTSSCTHSKLDVDQA